LHFAARHGNLPVLELLLQYGADEDAVDQFGCTPLHHAAGACREKDLSEDITEQERLAVVEALLDAGANMDIRDKIGNTPLHHTVSTLGWAGVVEALVERGMD
ncbi:ankyrin repeat protein, partial [Pyronema domesticum]